MSQNRRHFSRIHFRAEARLYVEGTEFPVDVIDLSLKGALITPIKPQVVTVGSPAILQLKLDELGPLIRMSGNIVHAARGELGFYCQEIDLDSMTHLRRLLELNLGDEALLQREIGHLLAD